MLIPASPCQSHANHLRSGGVSHQQSSHSQAKHWHHNLLSLLPLNAHVSFEFVHKRCIAITPCSLTLTLTLSAIPFARAMILPLSPSQLLSAVGEVHITDLERIVDRWPAGAELEADWDQTDLLRWWTQEEGAKQLPEGSEPKAAGQVSEGGEGLQPGEEEGVEREVKEREEGGEVEEEDEASVPAAAAAPTASVAEAAAAASGVMALARIGTGSVMMAGCEGVGARLADRMGHGVGTPGEGRATAGDVGERDGIEVLAGGSGSAGSEANEEGNEEEVKEGAEEGGFGLQSGEEVGKGEDSRVTSGVMITRRVAGAGEVMMVGSVVDVERLWEEGWQGVAEEGEEGSEGTEEKGEVEKESGVPEMEKGEATHVDGASAGDREVMWQAGEVLSSQQEGTGAPEDVKEGEEYGPSSSANGSSRSQGQVATFTFEEEDDIEPKGTAEKRRDGEASQDKSFVTFSFEDEEDKKEDMVKDPTGSSDSGGKEEGHVNGSLKGTIEVNEEEEKEGAPVIVTNTTREA